MFGEESSGYTSGITGSFKRLLESTGQFLSTKLELMGVEVQEEKKRILELLILTAAALLFGVLALTVFAVSIMAILLAKHLYAGLIIMSIAYLLISLGLFLWVRNKLQTATRLFETTVEELKKDTEWIKRRL